MAYVLKGVNSEAEHCDICGKTGLKRVMWIVEVDADGNETENLLSAGTTCGAKALGFKGMFSSMEQVAEAVKAESNLAKAIEVAEKMLVDFPDETEIAICRNGNCYNCVRGKAFDANPNRYSMPVRWING